MPTFQLIGNMWAIVLAGGVGARLRPLVKVVCGDERPKQYAPLLGSRSLLKATLDRVGRNVPPQRTVVVTVAEQREMARAELSAPGHPWLLVQPVDRGNAAAVDWAARLILERDRDAVVTVVASDHFVVDECRFAAHMAAIADYVRLDARPPIVLVGAVPDYSETEYGWIEPGSVLEGSPAGLGIRSVNRFCEKPSRQDAERCLRQGWLWNTMMIVGRAPDLVAACARTIPDVDSLLSSLISTPGTPASTRSFVELPRADFSRDVLQKAGPKLAVAPLPAVGWSDWGSPRRVVESLRGTASPPLWFRGYSESEAGTGPTETWAAAQEDDRRRALAPAGFSRDRN